MTTPTLNDDRIAKMRSTVMHVVDQDIAKRGHRARTTIGLAAASVVVIGFGSVGIGALSNGAGDGSDSAGGSSAQKAETAPRGALEDSAGDDSSAGSSTSSKSALPDDNQLKGSVPDADREVITTGEINVRVTDPRTVAQKISAYAETIGGRVDSRTEHGDGDDASAFVTVRVPSTKVTATIKRLDTYGKVTNVSLQNDDVTAQAKDLDARIEALQLSITRLERIMAKADTSSELIKAENALTQRQEQLESLDAQRKQMKDQVSLSTLSIDLSQKAKADSVEPGGFKGGLTDGWNALVSTVNNVVEVAGVLLPWLAIVVLLYGAYRLVARRRGWN